MRTKKWLALGLLTLTFLLSACELYPYRIHF